MADNFLSQEEVDGLLKGVAGSHGEQTTSTNVAGEVRPYNLADLGNQTRDRMPALELINERFSRALRSGLFSFLRRSVEVSVSPVKLLKYSEFIAGLAMPANLNLVRMKPLHGTALFTIDPNLIFLFVDNLFGGDGRFHASLTASTKERDFTQTEQRIILRILTIIFESYAKSWHSVLPVELEYLSSETNLKFINIGAVDDVMVCTTITVELGSVVGEIHLCMPYSMFEPIRDVLAGSIRNKEEGSEVDQNWRHMMTRQIQLAEVEIVADLGNAKMNLGDILNLRAGDFIPLSIPDVLCAKVDEMPVMECKYGVFNNQYALKVEKLLASSTQQSAIDAQVETK